MKTICLLTAVLFSLVLGASAVADDKPTVEITVGLERDGKATDAFATDTPKIFASFRTKGTKSGDKIRSAWVAEDVGDAAPKETKIDEATVTGDSEDFPGVFSLSKPNKGWPVGKYRVDFYIGESVIGSAKFTVAAATETK